MEIFLIQMDALVYVWLNLDFSALVDPKIILILVMKFVEMVLITIDLSVMLLQQIISWDAPIIAKLCQDTTVT
jgi:hypothetical protein